MSEHEDAVESDEEVRERLERMRRERDVRWTMSQHTLELAINALEEAAPPPRLAPGAGKSRRRKRRKRLL